VAPFLKDTDRGVAQENGEKMADVGQGPLQIFRSQRWRGRERCLRETGLSGALFIAK